MKDNVRTSELFEKFDEALNALSNIYSSYKQATTDKISELNESLKQSENQVRVLNGSNEEKQNGKRTRPATAYL
jgi:hypothetical protein